MWVHKVVTQKRKTQNYMQNRIVLTNTVLEVWRLVRLKKMHVFRL